MIWNHEGFINCYDLGSWGIYQLLWSRIIGVFIKCYDLGSWGYLSIIVMIEDWGNYYFINTAVIYIF